MELYWDDSKSSEGTYYLYLKDKGFVITEFVLRDLCSRGSRWQSRTNVNNESYELLTKPDKNKLVPYGKVTLWYGKQSLEDIKKQCEQILIQMHINTLECAKKYITDFESRVSWLREQICNEGENNEKTK